MPATKNLNLDLPDDHLLTPKQIAKITKNSIGTIYRWLEEAPLQRQLPANGSIYRHAYLSQDVKVWLQQRQVRQPKKKGINRTAYQISRKVIQLKESNYPKYLEILALLADEPGDN